MVRKFTLETVTYEKKVFGEATCDRCGKIVPEERMYETREFRLEFNTGDSYPDGSSGTVWEVEDLCDDCVVWLQQMLEANGVRINEYDY